MLRAAPARHPHSPLCSLDLAEEAVLSNDPKGETGRPTADEGDATPAPDLGLRKGKGLPPPWKKKKTFPEMFIAIAIGEKEKKPLIAIA